MLCLSPIMVFVNKSYNELVCRSFYHIQCNDVFKVRALINQLIVVNKPLHEEDVMILLLSLLNSYLSLIVALESISKTVLTMDYVTARLAYEVTKRKKKEFIGEQSILFTKPSMASTSFQCTTPKTCWTYRKPSHVAKN